MTLKVKKVSQMGGEHENYPTPGWAVRRLIESGALDLNGEWIEPAAGELSIVEQLASYPIMWGINDIRPFDVDLVDRVSGLMPRPYGIDFEGQLDYLKTETRISRYSTAITNPPFSLAEEFLLRMRQDAQTVALLLPMSFAGGAERQSLLREHRPDLILQFPDRIQFIAPTQKFPCDCAPPFGPGPDIGCKRCKGIGLYSPTSPSTDHAWWIWRAGKARRTEFDWLAVTPLAERQWWKQEVAVAA